MAKLLTLILTSLLPVDDARSHAVTQHVDLVEVNHYFDDAGKPVFDQLIFFNWDDDANRFSVLAWRLIKNQNQIPVRQSSSGQYYAAWHDGKILRLIYADRALETWTQFDPETVERAYLAKDRRPDLLNPPSKK